MPRRSSRTVNYAEAATSANTRLALHKDLARFAGWGGHIPSTAEQITEYLAAHAKTHKQATLVRWVASISKAHRLKQLESPCRAALVRDTLKGIANQHGAKQRRVAPALRDEVVAMVQHNRDDVIGLRNRALLLVGFAGAMRRSELAGLMCENIMFNSRGMIVNLGKTKTDQSGQDSEIAIPYAKGKLCPVKSLKHWLAIANITQGPVFRRVSKTGNVGKEALNPASIARFIKAAALSAGMDPADYSGHSLRAGLATSSAKEGKPFHKIKAQTRHKSDAMLLRYIRDAELFDDNAADLL